MLPLFFMRCYCLIINNLLEIIKYPYPFISFLEYNVHISSDVNMCICAFSVCNFLKYILFIVTRWRTNALVMTRMSRYWTTFRGESTSAVHFLLNSSMCLRPVGVKHFIAHIRVHFHFDPLPTTQRLSKMHHCSD